MNLGSNGLDLILRWGKLQGKNGILGNNTPGPGFVTVFPHLSPLLWREKTQDKNSMFSSILLGLSRKTKL